MISIDYEEFHRDCKRMMLQTQGREDINKVMYDEIGRLLSVKNVPITLRVPDYMNYDLVPSKLKEYSSKIEIYNASGDVVEVKKNLRTKFNLYRAKPKVILEFDELYKYAEAVRDDHETRDETIGHCPSNDPFILGKIMGAIVTRMKDNVNIHLKIGEKKNVPLGVQIQCDTITEGHIVRKDRNGMRVNDKGKKIIHVNRQHIAQNAKDSGNRPVYSVKIGSKTLYGREITINGPSRMVYDGKQLSCGARAWIETEADVHIHDQMTWTEAKDAV